MIRLVHQFDSPRTRAQAASPKSSACSCCCCCCVVTLVGTGVLTVRAVGRSTPPPSLAKLGNEPVGPADGSPFRPPGGEIAVPNARTLPKTRYKVLGFFLLPLALILSGIGARGAIPLGWLFLFTLYPAGLYLLRARAGLGWGWIIGLLLGVPAAAVLEAYIWISQM
jgi:hypothetical protein